MEGIVLNGRYCLLEPVGSGGMATVFRARDTLLQREVAVKLLREGYASDPAFLARFRREAQAAANLQHPNIVTVYDVGEDGGRHYIVMEFVHGTDLKSVVRQRGQLSVEEALDICIQISAGAGHAHRMGLVHCDVKPQNVLITDDGWAKVTDFGISRAMSELALTESELVWGSPIYFSPEQAAGEAPSPASDVYSIGVVLYEMLAGKPPFQADRSAALALMHLHEDPPPLIAVNPRVPPRVERMVRRALAKAPDDRFVDADEFAAALDEYQLVSTVDTGAHPGMEPRRARPDQSVRRRERGVIHRLFGSLESLDRPALALSIIALVAVIGLVPLWLLVYRAYSASSQGPAVPTVEATQPGTQVSAAPEVPSLVGKSIEEAEALLRSRRIGYTVEERESASEPQGLVIEQSPAAGSEMPAAEPMRLVVSTLSRELVVPQLAGYALGDVEEGLSADGLVLDVNRVWSEQPEGRILGQAPPAGTAIRTGETISLTVSGGTSVAIELRVYFADLCMLESARLEETRFRAGDNVAIGLRWLASRETDTNYTVFVHLIGPDGRLVAQQDEPPSVPTTSWVPNRIVEDSHVVSVPAGAAQGSHQIRVGLYTAGQPAARVPVVEPGLASVEANSVLVAQVQVAP